MTTPQDYKTTAFILRRTNIGEADRLLDLITPEGHLVAMARSSRREKSRLAGGIELFCLSEIQVHHSPRKKHNLLTSAKMQTFYRHILEDFDTLELASRALREIDRASREIDTPVHFSLIKQLFSYLDLKSADLELANLWFEFNLEQERGNELNLMFDTEGNPLRQDLRYSWDITNNAMRLGQGPITSNHIKFLRLVVSSPLALIAKVSHYDQLLPELSHILAAHRQK